MLRSKSARTRGLAELTLMVPAGKQLFLIFDRDGTLVPIADSPALAVLEPELIEILNNFVSLKNDRVAVVSARGLNSLQSEFDSKRIILAGNYGLEISFPSGKTFIHPEAEAVLPNLRLIRDDLQELLSNHSSLLLDDHKYSYCMHFHKLAINKRNSLHQRIEKLEQMHSKLHFRRLPTSYEILPPCKWDKSFALDKIAAEMQDKSNNTFHIAFGDSVADDPMFNWVKHRSGISFNVGYRSNTQANVRLGSPKELHKLLESLLKIA